MYDLERYLNVRSATGATLGPDGRLTFRMDTTGTLQLWGLDEPGAWPEQRTFYEDSVSFASYSPERPELVFGKDEGGDERMQLFRLDADGQITALTDRADAKHRWGGWSHDGERFAFASNRRDESVFDIYVQGRDDEEAELVHEGDGWLTVSGWSPDDERLLVGEAYSNVDQDLYVLDLESGDFDHLTPHEGEVRYGSAQWAPDGDGLYLVTDEGSDLRWLARLDLDGTLREVHADEAWNVDGVSVSHATVDSGDAPADVEGTRLAYSRNVDGYTDLTVGELTDETTIAELPEPDLPGGLAGGVSWGPDAEQFAVTVTGRTVNTNVFVVETETGESTRWTHASTAGIPESTFVAPELVHYETFDGREIPAFFSLPPENARDDDGVPVIVDIHGGPESQRRPSFSGLRQYFLSRGYALFEPNVRGSSGYGTEYMQLDDVENRMDSVRDIRAGVDWLHAHSAVDPDRLVAKGGSYGGFMVLSAMTEYPDLWAAGVDVVGIANFVTFLENTGDWRRSLREAEYGSLEDDREFLESVSPIHSADQIDAPLFVIHGENDPRVPVGEAEQIADAVRERDVPVELLVFDDEGHGIGKRENRIEAYTQVVDFLDDHV